MFRVAVATVLVVSGLLAARAQEFHAGVASRVFQVAPGRDLRGARPEMAGTVWYPVATRVPEKPLEVGPPGKPFFSLGTVVIGTPMAGSDDKLPLILLSHGTGGSRGMLAWLGTALARAGFIAVAVNHPGNNAEGTLTAQGFTLWWERATDLSGVLDAMLKDPVFGPRIDRQRIGAAGHSIGGYTVMELAGARTDFSVIETECHNHPKSTMCSVPEMHGKPVEAIEAEVKRTSAASLARSGESFRDERIRAVMALAPAQGQTLTVTSLEQIRIPVNLVVGDHDTMTPADRNAAYIHEHVPASELTVLPEVGHYDFVATCLPNGTKKLGELCADPPGVNRDQMHELVSRMAVAFFSDALQKQ